MTPPKKVLVTGANGHLGCNTVRSLLKKGYEVFPFVRESSDLRGLADLSDLHFRYGDVIDKESLEQAAQGCDIIIHHAAVYKIWAKSVEEIMEPAIKGTENVFLAASKAGVKKVIYTSSTTAVGTSENPKIVLTERDWNDQAQMTYARAKTQSERQAWTYSNDFKIPMVSLCPSGILGAYDYRVTPTSRQIVDMMKGIGLTVNAGFGYVDVRDVADLHVKAIEHGVPGEQYIVNGTNSTLKDLGDIYKKLTNGFVLHLNTPRFANIFSAMLMEGTGTLFNWTPPFTTDGAREYSHRYCNYDNSKSRKTFGFSPIPFEETVKETIRWFLFLNIGKVSNKVADNFLPDPGWLIPFTNS